MLIFWHILISFRGIQPEVISSWLKGKIDGKVNGRFGAGDTTKHRTNHEIWWLTGGCRGNYRSFRQTHLSPSWLAGFSGAYGSWFSFDLLAGWPISMGFVGLLKLGYLGWGLPRHPECSWLEHLEHQKGKALSNKRGAGRCISESFLLLIEKE